jgi:hypothetical protein
MVSEAMFGADRPCAQLALPGDVGATIERWLAEEGMSCTHASRVDLMDATLGAEPLVVAFGDGLGAGEGAAPRELRSLTEKVPIIAILDAEMVDAAGPLLDIDRAEIVAWPCGKETFMAVLQQVGSSAGFREPADSRPIAPRHLRDEVQRIARALSALVEEQEGATNGEAASRSAAESAALIRAIIRRRRARAQFFPADLFADPAWDILLDLAAARLEGARVSISSLCIAAAVPTTTALRWIKSMTAAGLLEREDDPNDGRRSFIRLSGRAAEAMEKYLTLIDGTAF